MQRSSGLAQQLLDYYDEALANRRYRSAADTNNQYRINIKVEILDTLRGFTGYIRHKVNIKYIPTNVVGVHHTDVKSAMKDVINKLNDAYEAYETFEATSDAVITSHFQPKPITLEAFTPEKSLPDEKRARDFCQDLIENLKDIVLIEEAPAPTSRKRSLPLNFTNF